MTKRRIGFLIIALLFVLAAIAVCIYYVSSTAEVTPAVKEISLWYINDGAPWSELENCVKSFNSGEGTEQGITVLVRSFANEEQLKTELERNDSEKGELPQLIICDTDFSAWLYEQGMVTDIGSLIDDPGSMGIRSKYLSASKYGDKLVAMPIAAETDVLIYNTELLSETDSLSGFEQLCTVANEYYTENKAGFFTIQDYASFFKTACAQLGESFDGVSPHDTDSQTCKYVYNCLAETAYNRGYCTYGENAAALVGRGELPCAIVSSTDVMYSAGIIDAENVEFAAYPVMSSGKAVLNERVTGISIVSSDEGEYDAAEQFVRWFVSKDVNIKFISDSGFITASGTMPDNALNILYSKLAETIKLQSDGTERVEDTASAEYFINSRSFNTTIKTIMESFN